MSDALSLSAKVRASLASGRPSLWFRSPDFVQAQKFVTNLCRPSEWPVFEWNAANGLVIKEMAKPEVAELAEIARSINVNLTDSVFTMGSPPAQILNPATAVKQLIRCHFAAYRAAEAAGKEPPRYVLMMRNLDRILKGQVQTPPIPVLVAELQEAFLYGKNYGFHIVVLSQSGDVPAELRRLFFVIDDEPPKRDDLLEVLKIVETDPAKVPTGGELEQLLEAARGLTRLEAEQAFADSLVRHGKLVAATINEIKLDTLRHSSQLNNITPTISMEQFAGVDDLAAFAGRCLEQRPRHRDARPRGILMVGPPGTGKTSFVGALARKYDLPAVSMNLGQVRSKWQGETDANLRNSLYTAAAMGRCILFVDELNHALAGSSGDSDGSTDGGTGKRILAEFLTFMTDPRHDVYVIGSCNSTRGIDSAFTRAGRFDAHFFFDSPSPEAAKHIWNTHLTRFGLEKLKPQVGKLDTVDWMGGEIEACCKHASMQDLSLVEASVYVPIYAKNHAQELDEMRRAASGRLLSTARPGLYRYEARAKLEESRPDVGKGGRRVAASK